MTFMEREIISQPSLLKKSVATNVRILTQIESIIRDYDIKTIVYVARGSSDNAGIYFKYLVEINIGIPVSMAAPSVLTIFNGKIDLKNTLVIGVSQSGEAKDVCIVLENANRQGALTIALTNNTKSPLANIARCTLDLAVEREISVAATKSFTAQLVLLACIAVILDSQTNSNERILNTLNKIEDVLSNKNNISISAKHIIQKNNVFVIGRGYMYSVAKELALKLQETSYIKALPFATSDFYHGPIALLDSESYILIFVASDESSKGSFELIKRISQITEKILVLTDIEDLEFENKIVVPKTDSDLAPILFSVAAQLLALEISINNGYNPDKPRNLKKVTITK